MPPIGGIFYDQLRWGFDSGRFLDLPVHVKALSATPDTAGLPLFL